MTEIHRNDSLTRTLIHINLVIRATPSTKAHNEFDIEINYTLRNIIAIIIPRGTIMIVITAIDQTIMRLNIAA